MIISIILLTLTYILNLIDYQQTIYAVKTFGLSVEMNPMGRWLLENNIAWVVKIIIVPLILLAMGIIIKIDPKQKWCSYVIFLWFLGLVIWNFYMLACAGLL